ncbi:MAG: hypothetical protein D6785_16510 [Planctomycetota bacterium]|nr:MAG: hypothetical protein D6785_16510 [Planctomycetota bacterium]
MAHAYTPGLKVTKGTRLKRRRILPLRGEVLVSIGDRVKAHQNVAQAFLPGKVFPVNLANKFGVEPAEIPKYLLVKEGEKIEQGQLLFETPGIFGFFKSRYHSPISGTLEKVSKVTGQIMLREPPTPIRLKAYISGKIVEVLPQEGVVVETEGALIQGIFGIGGERLGKIVTPLSKPDQELEPHHIQEDMKGKIVVGGSYLNLETFQKAQEIGVVGIVSGGFDDSLIKNILGYDIGVAITGSENIQTTLIMTEGFGRLPMAEKTFQLFKELRGKEASINGSTQIRAGVMRPEIIVPLDDVEIQEESEKEGILEKGTLVRIIRNPYFGELGTVLDLPPEPAVIETEAKVRILVVELQNGEKVTLPRANIEIIED